MPLDHECPRSAICNVCYHNCHNGEVEVDIKNYIWNHEKKPRGRGTWGFTKDENPDRLFGEYVFWSPSSTTYSDAKRQAQEFARKFGWHRIYLLP